MDVQSLTAEQLQKWSRLDLRMRDNVLSDIPLAHACPLDNGKHKLIPGPDLGYLSTLPLELLTDILLQVDLVSLTALRRVNRCGMQTIDSTPQYQKIYRQCPQVLRCIITTEAKWFDLKTLYQSLDEPRCRTCGDFGGYLYLITCVRVCYICFTEEKSFLPIHWEAACTFTGLDRKELLTIAPHIRGIPGHYADGQRFCRKRLTLLDRESLLPFRSRPTVEERSDRFCNDTRRFMAVVAVPYLDPESKNCQRGVYCIGCRESRERETYFRKQYTKLEFADHIKRYGPVDIWTAEDQPRHSPPDKPES